MNLNLNKIKSILNEVASYYNKDYVYEDEFNFNGQEVNQFNDKSIGVNNRDGHMPIDEDDEHESHGIMDGDTLFDIIEDNWELAGLDELTEDFISVIMYIYNEDTQDEDSIEIFVNYDGYDGEEEDKYSYSYYPTSVQISINNKIESGLLSKEQLMSLGKDICDTFGSSICERRSDNAYYEYEYYNDPDRLHDDY